MCLERSLVTHAILCDRKIVPTMGELRNPVPYHGICTWERLRGTDSPGAA